jgi:hypothetical protein
MFGDKQIYWRCLEQPLKLSTGELVPRWAEDWFAIDRAVMPLIHSWKHNIPRSEMISAYLRLVEIYSARALTVPTDKLPAFSGLTVRLFSTLGFDYVAGVWGEDIGHYLLWRSFSDKELEKRLISHPYVAPPGHGPPPSIGSSS